MKKLIVILTLLILTFSLHAQTGEYLRVGNVSATWQTFPGSIDSAIIVVEPKGTFAEVQVLLDFSTRCTNFQPNDSLEIQMGFYLPEQSEVTDLWLWFYQQPIRARMLNRQTATMIYEGIVNRREDPVLMFKNSETHYECRIFPLLTTLPRRIKLSYLTPISKLTANTSSIVLPHRLLKLTHCSIQSLKVGFKPGSSTLTNPSIENNPQLVFTPWSDSIFGSCVMAHIPHPDSLSNLRMNLSNSIIPQSYYAGAYAYNTPGTGVFQLELDLAKIFNVNKPKKTLFLFDFVQNTSSLSKPYILSVFKSYLKQHFNQDDSLNIAFSGYLTNFLNPSWFSGNFATLDTLFNAQGASILNSYSNLPVLLLDAIDFVRNNGDDASIVLISSSNAYTNINAANSFINSILSFMGTPLIPIHIISVDDLSSTNWNNSNIVYRGNEYLFQNLSILTGAEFQQILKVTYDNWYYLTSEYSTYDNMLSYVLPKLNGYFPAYNVQISLQSGFVYSYYNISNSNGFVYYGSPYRVAGKYTGSFPMNINISAQADDGQLYNTQLTLSSAQINTLDSMSQHLWAAQYLREMFTYTQSVSVVNQIIQTSITERVLTKYTALLAIEPDAVPPDTIHNPPGTTGGIIIGVQPDNEAIQSGIEKLVFYPNPVSNDLYFEFDSEKTGQVSIEIYTVIGKKSGQTYNYSVNNGSNKIHLTTDELPDGMYFFKICFENGLCETGKFIVRR